MLIYGRIYKTKYIEIFISFITLIAVIYIGKVQNDINQSILDISLIPSIKIQFNKNENQFIITNYGEKNIKYAGIVFRDKLNKKNKVDTPSEEDNKVIVPKDSNYIFAEDFDAIWESYVTELKNSNKTRVSIDFSLLVEDVKNNQYIIKKEFIILKYKNDDNVFQILINDKGMLSMPWDKYLVKINNENV